MKMKSCSEPISVRKVDEVRSPDGGPAGAQSVDDNDSDRVDDGSILKRRLQEPSGESEGGNGSLLLQQQQQSSLGPNSSQRNGRKEINGPGPAGCSNGKMTVGVSSGQTSCKREHGGCCQKLEAQLVHFSRGTTWLSILLGQVLSLLLCISGVTNVYLIDRHNIRIPTAQNFGFYIVLATIFTTMLACRPADRNLFPILRTRGWKYAIVALVDAEAKFLVCKSYQLTTLTSAQLLDCFGIPTVLSLSWLVLRIRYKVPHILGVSVSLLGICCLVWADIEDGKMLGPGKNRFVGDMLCLSGAFLHGISDVAQEFVVKTFDTVEFLGMMGLFGSFFSGTQTVVLEYGAVASTDWSAGSGTTPIALIVGYTVTQTAAYMVSVMVMKWSSATFVNLSLLTADFYSLIVGIYLFQMKVHSLYFVSFGLVMLGVLVFSAKPTILSSHIYKSLTREHTTTLDLELMASAPTGPGGGNSNRSSVNYVLRDNGHSLLDEDDEMSLSPCGNGTHHHHHHHHQSVLIVDKGLQSKSSNGGGNGCPMLSIQNCDVVMQTSLGTGGGGGAAVGCNFNCNASNNAIAGRC